MAGHGGTPATVALTRAGIPFRPHNYDHDPAVGSFGLEAAQKLGTDPDRVLKTLIVTVDDRLTVAVLPVTGQLDLKALARAYEAKRAQLADSATAERSSGYVLGGISPVGQRRRLPTLVDVSVLNWSTVYVSGGRRGFDIELAPPDLVAITAAITAPVSRSAAGA